MYRFRVPSENSYSINGDMKILEEKKQKQDKLLTMLLVTTSRIEETAKNICKELDNHNNILNNLDTRIDNASHTITSLNSRIENLFKKASGFNILMYVAGFLIILGIVGVILSFTGVF